MTDERTKGYVKALETAYVNSATLWTALNRLIPGTHVVVTAQDEATAKGQLTGLREAFAMPEEPTHDR